MLNSFIETELMEYGQTPQDLWEYLYMRKFFGRFCYVAFLLTILVTFSVSFLLMLRSNEKSDHRGFSGAYSPLRGSSVKLVFERANPAVVRITSTHILDQEESLPQNHPEIGERRSRGIGTGCIIDGAGYIVTNHHVVEKAEQIRVRFYDNQELSAKIVGADRMTDLALLKVDTDRPLVVMPLGDSSEVKVGEEVIAIGNPYSYDRTVTKGIVSAKNRKVFGTLYEDYIQTDAAINSGNSGGPLLNMAGELIGINTIVRADANGISFAIPADQVKQIVSQLKLHGHVTRGFLGVQPEDISDEMREAMGLSTSYGAIVTHITEDSAASKAGLEVYDVITRFNRKEVLDKDSLYKLIAETPPGKSIEVEVIRGGSTKQLFATLAERDTPRVSTATPKEAGKPKENGKFGKMGFLVEEIGSSGAKEIVKVKTSPFSGVVVSDIDSLSCAAEAGLKRGFIITEVNRKPVSSTTEFEDAIKELKDSQAVMLRVARANSQTLSIIAFRICN
ncbi:MAG: trypsin-like peptidase domain-containing protein [Blastocatellia bacterium]|nr:trypsin-like peptidase domain-containing protein [Blastocatellia bacterium]